MSRINLKKVCSAYPTCFPWFKDQKIKAILDVEEPSPGHFYWPSIDVDLTLEIIKHPERFPMKAKTS